MTVEDRQELFEYGVRVDFLYYKIDERTARNYTHVRITYAFSIRSET